MPSLENAVSNLVSHLLQKIKYTQLIEHALFRQDRILLVLLESFAPGSTRLLLEMLLHLLRSFVLDSKLPQKLLALLFGPGKTRWLAGLE